MVTTRRNSDDDVPNFEAMINAAVANALPNLTAALRTQITNDIRNGAGPSGGGGGDAIPPGIHVWIESFGLSPTISRPRLAAFKLEGDATELWKLIWHTQVAAAARNIELLHESGNSNKRDRDGNRFQNRGQGQQENKVVHDRDFRGQDQRFTGRNGNDRQGQGNYNQRQHRGQSTRDFNQGHASGSAGQRRSTETLPPPPLCTTCGKPHPGVCYKATGGCFTCGSTQHKVKDCPQAKQKQSMPADFARLPPTTGRVYATTRDQAAKTSGTITGTLYIDDRTVFVLFDTGATHSIISTTFAKKLNMTPTPLIERIIISTPMKNHMLIDMNIVNRPSTFDDRKFIPANLLPILCSNFDVILGKELVASHRNVPLNAPMLGLCLWMHHYGSINRLKLSQMPRPTMCGRQVRSSSGLAGYYRCFIEGSPDSPLPLTQLMRKGEKFVWTVDMSISREFLRELKTEIGKAYVVATHLANLDDSLFVFIILRDLERLDVELCVRGSGGYWASMRIESNLMLQIKEAQRDDGELWAIVQNVEDGTLARRLWNGSSFVPNYYSSQGSTEDVKIEHQRASGLLQPLEIPMWKWDEISMDFVTGLPTTQKRHDAIWVVVDRLTKSAHFLPIRKNYGISKLAEIFRQEIVRLHGTPTSIMSDRDPKFTSHFWKGLQKAWGTRLKFSTTFDLKTDGQSERTIQTLEDMLRACALEWTGSWDEYLCLVEFAYNNSWHASIKAAPFELLYGRKCRAPICWDEVGERLIEGPELIEITNEKVAVAKEKLKEARSRQKSYADKHRRDLEFQVGDRCILKSLPFRGVNVWDQGQSSVSIQWVRLRFWKLLESFVLSGRFSTVYSTLEPDMSLSEETESILDRHERVMRIQSYSCFVKILLEETSKSVMGSGSRRVYAS
ncbi:DNA/RNA polymerases superfamily protein [Tanacetum coccineum]